MAGRYADQVASPDAEDFSLGCRQVIEAIMIAIDAPCRWSSEGRPRPCDWEQMAKGNRCFATPRHRKALTHPRELANG